MNHDKVILLLPAAVDWVEDRTGIRAHPPLLWALYAIRRHGGGMTREGIRKFVTRCKYRVNWHTMSDALTQGVAKGLLSNADLVYSLTPTGREYLSRIRQYLTHQRFR